MHQIHTFEQARRKARVQKYWKILLATEPETWHMKHEVLKSTERKISASVNGVVWRGEGKMDGGKGAIAPHRSQFFGCLPSNTRIFNGERSSEICDKYARAVKYQLEI